MWRTILIRSGVVLNVSRSIPDRLASRKHGSGCRICVRVAHFPRFQVVEVWFALVPTAMGLPKCFEIVGTPAAEVKFYADLLCHRRYK